VAVSRRTVIDPQIAESAELMHQQREEIKAKRDARARRRNQANRFTQTTGLDLPPDGLAGLTLDEIRAMSNLVKNGGEQ